MEELPPGFRFYPTEEELVGFYLKNKLEGKRQDLNQLIDRVIPVIDIYNYHPSYLPQISEMVSHQHHPEQWIFFVPRKESERRGGRPCRQTADGFWKATGSAGLVYSSNDIRPIGGKRTMVFYKGRAPNGTKTDWRMNEYTSLEPHHHQHDDASSSAPGFADSSSIAVPDWGRHDEYSICRVYTKPSRVRSFDRRPIPERRPPAPTTTATVLNPQSYDNNQSELFTNSLPIGQNPRDQTAEMNALLPWVHHQHDQSPSSSPPSSPPFWEFQLDSLEVI